MLLACRPIQVMGFADFAESDGGRFGSQVALRGGQEFVADHELANGGGAQERRKIVRVQVPGLVELAVGWALMETHGIGKSRFKQIVVTNGDAAKDVAEKIAFVRVQLVDRRNMAFA